MLPITWATLAEILKSSTVAATTIAADMVLSTPTTGLGSEHGAVEQEQ